MIILLAVIAFALSVLGILLWIPIIADISHITSRKRGRPLEPSDVNLLFLIPAHDEELLIADCLRSIQSQETECVTISTCVIADNCSDDTVKIARSMGAQVLERHDMGLRGKPFALDWALGIINLSNYDAISIIDADTTLEPTFAQEMSRCGPLREKIVQPYNGVENRDESALTRMAAIQSEVLHGVAFPLKARSGVSVPLSSGMTIGTEILRRIKWSAFSIGEDFEYYVLMTLRGVEFDHASTAVILAQEAKDLRQGESQRMRWMAGRIFVLRQYLPEVLKAKHLSYRQRLDLIGEMMVTSWGPATQGALTVGLSLAALLLPVPYAEWLAVFIGLSLTRLVFYTLVAIARDPEPSKAILAFFTLPPYALWRLTVAAKSLFSSGTGPWVRTSRHHRFPPDEQQATDAD